jgi:hypothetical protein
MPIIRNLPADAYWDHPAVSSTTLKKYRLPTRAHTKHQIDNPKTDTEALIRGQVTHCLVLESHRLDLDFVIEKEKLWHKNKLAKNGGSKEEWALLKKEAEERLVPLVSNKVWVQAQGMANSIKSSEYWQDVALSGEKELSIFTEIKGVPVKARLDAKIRTAILDIKSCRFHITDKKIRSVIAELGYHISGAMYLEVAKAAGLEVDCFVWVFVESFEPYLCRFVEATPKMLEIGKQEFYICLEKHADCMQSQSWPGYPQLDEKNKIPQLDLPDWYSMDFITEETYESDSSDEYDDY